MLTRQRLRTLEASAALIVSDVLLRTLPFSRISGPMLAGKAGARDSNPQPPDHPSALAVGRSIGQAADLLPWRPTCLVQALAGRFMLSYRGIRSALVLGVTRQDGELLAHAWLVAGGGTVCGGSGASGFVPIATFGARNR